MSWKIYAAIAAAASNHIGTQMSARNQRAPSYAGDLSVSDIQAGNISANLNNSPYYERLAMLQNQTNQAQNIDILEQAIPGYAAWSKQQSDQAKQYASGGMTRGELDVLQKQSYESSYSTGIRGQAQQYRTAADIGRAQVQNAQYSQSVMQQLQALAKVNLSGVGQFYTTTQDAINTAMANKQAEQAYLNAKQASDNVRKNAGWAALSTSGTTWAKMMGGSGQGEDMNQFQNVNYAYKNNSY